MEEFVQALLKKPWVAAIVWIGGAIGWVIGLVSGLVQLKSYKDQKKLEKGYISVLEQAKRDWEGKYTEEEIKKLAHELARLQTNIQKDVPNQARKVFLEDQRVTLLDNIGEMYTRYQQISGELEKKEDSDILPNNIKEAIEYSILPSYVLKQRQQRMVSILILLILGLLVLTNYSVFAWVFGSVIHYWLGIDLNTFIGFVLLASCELWLFAKICKGKVKSWFSKKSYLSLTVALLTIFIAIIPSLLFWLQIKRIYRGGSYVDEQIIRSFIAAILLMPAMFAILWNYYSFANDFFVFGKFIANLWSNKRSKVR